MSPETERQAPHSASDRPEVTVLMSVFNGERYLRGSIESLLAQTFEDFEFLIIDDGSTDASREIIEGFDDPRIRLIDLPENRGLIAALNLGLEEARGTLLARHDADDLAFPTRLEQQVEFMRAHPETVLVGSWLQLIDQDGEEQGVWEYPVDPIATAWTLLFNSPTAHSSVLFRTETARQVGGYRVEFPHAEDFDLWSRLAEEGSMQNIPECLERYRVHTGGVSSSKKGQQEATRYKVSERNIRALLGESVDGSIMEILGDVRTARDGQELLLAASAYRRLFDAFAQRHRSRTGSIAAAKTDCEDRIRYNADSQAFTARLSCLVRNATFFSGNFWTRGRFLHFIVNPRLRQRARKLLGLEPPPVLRI